MPRSNLRLRHVVRAYAISIAFWLAATPLMSWQMYGLAGVNLPVTYGAVTMVYAARYLSVALLTPPIFYLVSRWPVTDHLIRRGIAYAGGCVPFSIAFGVVRWLILPPWNGDTKSWGPRTFMSLYALIHDTFVDQFVLYLAVVVAAHAYTYFVLGRRQEFERLQLRQCLAQSELQALRAQLQPHFLFNTLQGVSTLIDTDRSTAQSMLLTLAGLLRKVLKHDSTDLIAFREELAFVKGYLQLEYMRLGRRLQVRWQITPEVDAALIPQLLLQPLIENAVVHGTASSRDGGWIEIEARVQQGRLIVTIRNSISGSSPAGLGVGLKNTTARLQFLYGGDAAFEFAIQGKVAVARLAVPAFTGGLAEAAGA